MAHYMHEILQESAREFPERAALEYGGKTMSYSELDAFSDRIASCLIESGVRPGDRVGLYSDKTPDAIAAVYGISKAGAAYVPFDPSSPPKRQSYVIGNCSIDNIIVSVNKTRFLKSIFPGSNPPGTVMVVDSSNPGKQDIPEGSRLMTRDMINAASPPEMLPEPGDIANILYTSGTTGEPKGVALSHGALVRSMGLVCGYFGLSEKDRVLSLSPLSFGMSLCGIFATAMAGGALCLISPGTSAFSGSLADLIGNERITVLHSVPFILTQLALHGTLEDKDLSSVKKVIFAGGRFFPRDLERLMKALPDAEFFNVYGSTETFEISCCRVEDAMLENAVLPMGDVWPGVELYLVDEKGERIDTRAEVTGELLVSSDTLMEGYWEDDERTGEVLFTPPFSGGKKVYRTGDMVRIGEEGDYFLTGRADGIIKKGGYRVGLAEIEAALAAHASVKEAAVTGAPDPEMGQIIRAVIVPAEKGFIDEDEIKSFCSKRLPLIMVPDIVEFKGSLPRTSTGKISRKDL